MTKIKTSHKILSCATTMFAQYGYDGTIMDNLAKECGVNKASIYYHHKDKSTLYENSLISLFTPIADAVIASVDTQEDPIKKLESHIQAFARANAENPNFSAILMREMASGGINMPATARQQMERILSLLSKTLKLGHSMGIFKPVEPLMTHFMIVGTLNLFVTSLPFRKALAKKDNSDQPNSFDIDSAAIQISNTIITSLLVK